MATTTARLALRAFRPAGASFASAPRPRSLCTTSARLADKLGATTQPNANPGGSRQHINSDEHRLNETARRGMNPVPESAEQMPRVGAKAAPPELAGEVQGEGDREGGEMAEGGWGNVGAGSYVQTSGELEVGELEGGSFKVEPLRRTGEDEATIRARLLCAFLPLSVLSRVPVPVVSTFLANPRKQSAVVGWIYKDPS